MVWKFDQKKNLDFRNSRTNNSFEWEVQVLMLVRVLFAPSGETERKRFTSILELEDVVVHPLSEEDNLWERLSLEAIDLVLASPRRIPKPVPETISSIRALPEAPEIVLLVEKDEAQERALLLTAGALAVINTDVAPVMIEQELGSLIERVRESTLIRYKAEQPPDKNRLSDFITLSPAMKKMMTIAHQVVAVDSSVLILGETGVGKEWLARAIHKEGPRSSGPFVPVNCGAIPETLLESELFGHEEGAFTGARKSHRGYFETAHSGTIFLDEIAELLPSLQVRLLRVLQDRKIRRLGAEREIEIDARILAATNRDLDREIQEKKFRADLYYRLGVVTLEVPPLRARREDIPDLVMNYLGVFRTRLLRDIARIRSDALRALETYEWPGNVRELINVMERAVLLSTGREITLEDLPGSITGGVEYYASPALVKKNECSEDGLDSRWLQKPLREAKREQIDIFEREYLAGLLSDTRGHIGETARRAGISTRSVFEKMRRHGLRKESFKQQSAGSTPLWEK